ncbi:MAG: hypothetical protein H6813_00365 [Phycisphaeraceae bacterium]|nr:hypothetical protein [Phycisphaeraceae bacterium]MCB9847462.1 hypothetical protein [Phycisphaeraceae bacterium]
MNGEATTGPGIVGTPAELDYAPVDWALGYEHACAVCGYSLRGLAVNANCPECATPVQDSLRGKQMRHANPEYVRRLRSGARMITLGALLPIPVIFLAMMMMTALTLVGPVLGSALGLIPPIVGVVLIWSSFLFGWLRLTTREHRVASDSKAERVRARCRQLSVVIALAIPGSYVFAFSGGMMTLATLRMGGVQASGALTMISSVTVYVLITAQFWYAAKHVRHVCSRLPATGLPAYASVVFWFVAVSMGLSIIQSVTGFFVQRSVMAQLAQAAASPPPGQGAALPALPTIWMFITGILLFLLFLLNFAIYVMYIGLYARLWSHLSKQVARAASRG